MTLEEEVKPELLWLFKKAGLEITLKTLNDWLLKGLESEPSRWWVHRVVANLITSAYTIYERRTFVDENS